ncbi:MAG: hypothetical protein U5J63_03320 [Fodinibius sp.]|nr:hypothetical protein [Fodinibius sp.]
MAITEKDLKDLFGAEKTDTQPSDEELEFLEERSQLEADTFPLLSIEQYERNYERFCEYGLEKELTKRVEPHIRYLSRFEPKKLLGSTFYKRFKSKKFVKKYVEENIDLKEQRSDQ